MKRNSVRQICNLTVSKRRNPNQNRVYDKFGLSPCIVGNSGGGLQPIVPVAYETD